MLSHKFRTHRPLSPWFRLSAVGLMLLPLILLLQQPANPLPGLLQAVAEPEFGQFPFQFVANQGQLEPGVQFQAQTVGGTVAFSPQEVSLRIPTLAAGEQVLRLAFVDANPSPVIQAGNRLPGHVNVIRGCDPGGWFTRIPAYEQIEYRALYPGVHLRYEGAEAARGALKGTFAVAPGANPSLIRWRYGGAEAMAVDEASGDLSIRLPGGSQVVEQAPVAWQDINSQRVSVPVAYVLDGGGSIGFDLGSYDRSAPLTIDPTIIYETTVSGGWLDHGLDVATDTAGNAYVVAYAFTDDHSVFVAKLDGGGGVAWTTHLDGSSIDYGQGIAVGGGVVHVAGFTDSEDFPILDPLQDTLVGFRDAFLSKLSAGDGTLLYSTFLGGNYTDQAGDLAINSAGETVLVGSTWSDDFPTVDPIQGEHQGPPYAFSDIFVTRLSADGSEILYSTYLGGYRDDSGTGIALDDAGRIYITGDTDSDDFPTRNPIQPTYAGAFDGFVARILADGSALDYATYLGGENSDAAKRVDVDSAGSAYVSGSTLSVGFPTTAGAFQEDFVGGILACEVPFGADRNCYDMFVSKLSPDGSALAYSTYVGGTRDDESRGIAVDSAGGAHMVGYTYSTDFPLSGGCFGCVISPRLNAAGSDLLYTFVADSGSANAGHGITVDDAGATYITGAMNVPADVYVAKITGGDPPYDTMHVERIDLRGRTQGGRYLVRVRVIVLDQNSDPVPGANVTVGVTTPLDPYRLYTRPTNPAGRAFLRAPSRFGGHWEFCVTDLVKAGWVYDPAQNVEVCDTINYP